MNKYCIFVCIVMIVDAAPVDASAMNAKDIVADYAKTIASHSDQEVASELPAQQNAHSLKYLLSIGTIGSRVIEFLDENTEEITAAQSCKPSFVLEQQENFMYSVHNSNLTQFMDAWTMLHFYTSNFPQLQKYSQFCDIQGHTSLHVAVVSSLKYNDRQLQKMHDSAKPLILRKLLQKNSHIDIHAQDALGATAMHYAAQRHNVSVIKMLKKAGANINEKDKKGNTPLHYVINVFNVKNTALAISTIETLIFLGAHINEKNNEKYMQNNQNFIGMTPFKLAERIGASCELKNFIIDLGGKY